MTAPYTISDFLRDELDKKLASLPNDQARYRCLIMQGNIWAQYYREWAETGAQPFGGPHPEYGYMDAFAFRLVLTFIEFQKVKLEQARVPA